MGDISRRFKASLFGLAIVVLLGIGHSPAQAGTATTGSSFPITYLSMLPNTVAGSESATMGPGYMSSPISGDGRYVFFASKSDNLTTGYNLETTNVFRKDTQTGDIVLVNRADGMNGPSFDGYLYDLSPSDDGNLVAMVTDTAVDPADSDGESDVYLRDIAAGTTTLLTPSITDSVDEADLSADGNFLAFTTDQALYPGDSNGLSDVYRMNVASGVSTIVSATNGTSTAGNERAITPSISGDGNWVVFSSRATNMIAGFTDNNGVYGNDVFLRNMTSNATSLVSARYNSASSGGNDGSEDPVIAGAPVALADVKVAFDSYSTNLADNNVTDPDSASSVYLRSMSSLPSELVSRADGAGGASADSRAHTPSISDDASRITFSSDATNLGAGDSYYGTYLRDRTAATTSLVSARNDYAIQGEISADGGSATWAESGATPDSDPLLPAVFKRSLPAGRISLVSRPKGGDAVRMPGFENYSSGNHVLSATGRFFVFSTSSSRMPGYIPNEQRELAYRRDLKTGDIDLVSRANGKNGDLAVNGSDTTVSADGNVVAFRSDSALVPADINNLADVYVRNVKTGVTTLVSRGDGANGAIADDSSGSPVISGNGQRVAFTSRAGNLGSDGVSDQVYIRDLQSKRTFVVSRASGEAGTLGNGNSTDPDLSYNGARVIYSSYATNLHPDDSVNQLSSYMRNLNNDQTLLVSREPGLSGASLDGYSYGPTISGDGGSIAFVTYDADSVPSVSWPAALPQIVVRDTDDGSSQMASISSTDVPGDSYSGSPSFSHDGKVIAFDTSATNLRDSFDNTDRETVVVRDLTTGTVKGPPRFGLSPSVSFGGASNPSISADGNCVAFDAVGHNNLTGILGDFSTTWIYVNRGTCLNPRILVPKLSAISLKPAKFRVGPKPTATTSAKRKAPRGTKIRFRLNTKATVTIWIEQKLKRGKAKARWAKRGKLVRKNLAAGRRTVPFSGKVGKRALKPGVYRMRFQASTATDRSAKAVRAFRIVK